MMKNFLLLPICFCALASAYAENKKDIFEPTYPKVVGFRQDNNRLEEYDDYMRFCVADIRKMIDEEIKIVPNQKPVLEKYYAANPRKSAMLHLNGEAIHVRERKDVQAIYSPCHWLCHEGSNLKSPISKNDTLLKLDDVSNYNLKAYPIRSKRFRHGEFGDNPPKFCPHDLLIIERNPDGTLDWSKTEFAALKSIDKKNNTIEVERGKWLSEKRNFSKSAYVAPIVGADWGNDIQWHLNLSAACPPDKNGKKAADIFLEEIVKLFDRKNGYLKHVDGIGWDVHYWFSHFKNVDTNFDGKADDGVIDGKNLWLENMIEFDTKLRKKLGKDFIITGDSWYEAKQRGVGSLYNGMENEGICRPNETYRGISSPINMMGYWQKFGQKNSFSYMVLKFQNCTDEEMRRMDEISRMGMAISTILGCGFTQQLHQTKGLKQLYAPQEIMCGKENKYMWLGKPEGDTMFLSKVGKDILNSEGKNLSADFMKSLEYENCSIKKDKNSLLLEGNFPDSESFYPGKDQKRQILKIKNIKNPKSDIVLRMEVLAEENLKEFTEDTQPRHIKVSISPEPKYFFKDGKRHASYFNDLQAYFGKKAFFEASFYFRNLEDLDADTFDLEISFEGPQKVRIKNITIHSAQELLAREFEHGAVLANPSLKEAVFDLTKLFPNVKKFKKIDSNEPQFANEKFKNALDKNSPISKMMEFNNGELIKNPKEFKLSPLNGIFLIKK